MVYFHGHQPVLQIDLKVQICDDARPSFDRKQNVQLLYELSKLEQGECVWTNLAVQHEKSEMSIHIVHGMWLYPLPYECASHCSELISQAIELI